MYMFTDNRKAIIAFLLLFATFAIGLRCFADFDKGLLKSKMHGQSYRPVGQPYKSSLFGDSSFVARHHLQAQILIFYSRHRRRKEGRRRVRFRGTARPAGVHRVGRLIPLPPSLSLRSAPRAAVFTQRRSSFWPPLYACMPRLLTTYVPSDYICLGRQRSGWIVDTTDLLSPYSAALHVLARAAAVDSCCYTATYLYSNGPVYLAYYQRNGRSSCACSCNAPIYGDTATPTEAEMSVYSESSERSPRNARAIGAPVATTALAELLPVAVGRGCVAIDVPSNHGECGGGEESCGKLCRGFVPFVHASVGWSFMTVTLREDRREGSARSLVGERQSPYG